MIGPNGAGKSTFLKILAGLVEPDSGSVIPRKFLKIAYLSQDSIFDPKLTLQEVVNASLDNEHLDENERKTRVDTVMTKVGFENFDDPVSKLSGGWRKRLALAAELVKEPDLLLLDEPTNHLDLEGVLWLEDLLKSAQFAYALVSHDRSFLQNVSTRIIELNQVYKDGFLSVKGPYSDFLEARAEYMVAQKHEQQSLASKVRREIAWLSRGARARQTKSVGRIRDAEKLMQEFDDVKARNAQNRSVDIDFAATGRRTKELIVCKGISKKYGEKKLFSGLDLTLHPGDKLGLLGTNGSGKTTLLTILADKLKPDSGTIKRADGLRIVWFDQNREQLNQTISLKQALSPTGDAVVYQNRSIHVATWAKRFLFKTDQLNMPVSYLSGGEQARILIANLMLQPADILILDEPTNDLDIPSLEVLEDSLEEFPGAVVLVTHDRFMLDTISHQLLALDGEGGCAYFADYAQWESRGKKQAKANKAANKENKTSKEYKTQSQDNKIGSGTEVGSAAGPSGSGAEQGTDARSESQVSFTAREKGSNDAKASQASSSVATQNASAGTPKRPLSTAEKKELTVIESKIETAEKKVESIKEQMHLPEFATNHAKLAAKMEELHAAEDDVRKLYEKWDDMESRK